MSEREHIEDAKEDIAKAKAALKQVIAHLSAVMDANAGEAARSNAAYLARAKFKRVLANLEEAHGEATQLLLKHWPGYEGVVVALGGTR